MSFLHVKVRPESDPCAVRWTHVAGRTRLTRRLPNAMGPRTRLAALAVLPAVRPTPRRISTSTAWCASPPRESSHGSSRAGAPSPAPDEPGAPSSNPDASETGLVLSPPTLLPFPDATFSSSFAPADPSLPFSTSRFVTALERRSGGTLGRGVSTALMEATRDILMKEEGRVASESWRRGDLENVSRSAACQVLSVSWLEILANQWW